MMLHTEEETSVVHEEEGGKSTMKAGEVSGDAGIVADADGLEEGMMKDAERRRLLQMEPLVVDETAAVDDADEGGYDCCCC